MTKFCEQILTEAQRALFVKLGPFAESHQFHLAGGTAVALHLGHRRSVDFDWITQTHFDDPERLLRDLRQEGFQFKGRPAPATLIGTISKISTSFVWWGMKQINSPLDYTEFSCKIASLEDLAGMKVAAATKRGSMKDFIDIHAMSAVFSLNEMLGFYKKKYEVSDISSALQGLVYFRRADNEPMPDMLEAIDWEQIKTSLKEWIVKLTE